MFIVKCCVYSERREHSEDIGVTQGGGGLNLKGELVIVPKKKKKANLLRCHGDVIIRCKYVVNSDV